MTILDLIDGAVEDYNASCDAMRWTPEPPTAMPPAGRTDDDIWLNLFHLALGAAATPPPPRPDGRAPYEQLTKPERDALHAWCELHHVIPAQTPVDARIDYDPVTNEWIIDQHSWRNGHAYVLDDGESIATHRIRRAYRADLPWRMAEEVTGDAR